jgi:hypothetical protein
LQVQGSNKLTPSLLLLDRQRLHPRFVIVDNANSIPLLSRIHFASPYLRRTMKSAPSADQRILDIALVLAVVYNLAFLLDVIGLGSGALANGLASLMDQAQANKGILTWIEGLAAAAIFLDIVVRFDDYGKRSLRGRNVRLVAVAIACTGLVFKAFTFYLDSSFLE